MILRSSANCSSYSKHPETKQPSTNVACAHEGLLDCYSREGEIFLTQKAICTQTSCFGSLVMFERPCLPAMPTQTACAEKEKA